MLPDGLLGRYGSSAGMGAFLLRVAWRTPQMMEHLVPVFHAQPIPIGGSSKQSSANFALTAFWKFATLEQPPCDVEARLTGKRACPLGRKKWPPGPCATPPTSVIVIPRRVRARRRAFVSPAREGETVPGSPGGFRCQIAHFGVCGCCAGSVRGGPTAAAAL